MATSARQELMAESYDEVEKLIWDVVHRFRQKHGNLYGTLDELFSEACVGFMIAYRCYNPSKASSFPTYVRMVVNHTLLELTRNETKFRVRHTPSDEDPIATSHSFSLVEFLDEVSEDARAIVMLVIDTPNDLMRLIQKDKDKNVIRLLGHYLSGLGWEVNRIKEGFSEIEKALC